jgi:DNA-binding MarR family transcriptional regulator
MRYTLVPHTVIDDDRLDIQALAVLVAIRSFAFTIDAGCTANLAKIAKRARCSISTTKLAIARLADLGYIERVAKDRRNELHRLPNQIILALNSTLEPLTGAWRSRPVLY